MAAPTKAAKGSKLQVATSNDLITGDVVFMTAHNGWTRDINESEIATGKQDWEALLARANSAQHHGVTVGAYLCAVEMTDDGKPYPKHYREIMRVTGPSCGGDVVNTTY